jgi:hypothetical protein
MGTPIKLNPSYGSWANTLNDRKNAIAGRDVPWNYQKYAYFVLYSQGKGSASDEHESILTLAQKNKFSGGIGTTYQGGFLQAFHKAPKPSTAMTNIKELKPSLTSATISVQGGDNLYDSYIKNIDIKFKVYTKKDLDNVEKSFFLPGAKATIKYGWIDAIDKNLKKTEYIRIYNFGFTMNTDGSYDCNIKALTRGFFAGAHSTTPTIKLTTAEQDALGPGSAVNATLTQALIAKAYCAFGGTAAADRTSVHHHHSKRAQEQKFAAYLVGDKNQPSKGLKVASAGSTWGPNSEPEFWMSFIKENPQNVDVGNCYPYMKFGKLIQFLQANLSDHDFIFDPNGKSINPPTPYEEYGSADPRKYIFPGSMAKYRGTSNPQPVYYAAPTEMDIDEILVSLWTVDYFYNALTKAATKINMKPTPPTIISLIRALSNDMYRLSGGLVDIQVRKTDKTGEFSIYNQTHTENVKKHPTPYRFTVLGRGSIVKDVSLSSDFDVKTMMQMSIARVKAGEFNIAPLKAMYPGMTDVPVNTTEKTAIDANKTAKLGISEHGIDDAKAQSIADNMRKRLVVDSGKGTFTTFPYNLKLSITVEGIENVGFMHPVTIDRLPSTFQKHSSVRFLVTGIEHSFDGQGGWDTTLQTAMKVGDVQ